MTALEIAQSTVNLAKENSAAVPRGTLLMAQGLLEAYAENKRLLSAFVKESHDVEQTLGKALNYPIYPADGPGNPGDYCVGDHVPASLAMEAADKLKTANDRFIEADRTLRALRAVVSGIGCFECGWKLVDPKGGDRECAAYHHAVQEALNGLMDDSTHGDFCCGMMGTYAGDSCPGMKQ